MNQKHCGVIGQPLFVTSVNDVDYEISAYSGPLLAIRIDGVIHIAGADEIEIVGAVTSVSEPFKKRSTSAV